MNTRRRFLGIGMSVIALGALPGLVRFIFAGSSLHDLEIDALTGALYSASIAIPCWALLPRLFCRINESTLRTRIVLALIVMSGLAAAGTLITTLILHVVGRHGGLHSFALAYRDALRICLAITLTAGVLTLFLQVLQGQLSAAREELHQRQMAEERERKMAAEARFASLESRVHPHFLFNTLNSIAALIREDPAKAEQLVERLSLLLRFSLDSEVEGLVKLSEELEIVRTYLEIEKVRFGDRLRYRIVSEPAAETRQVPALSVQTLVENSVKYAVGSRREGAEIVVNARLDRGKLYVEVSDDGPGFEPSQSFKPGHGLDLLQRRLGTLFGATASLEVSGIKGGTRVAIACPEAGATATT